METYIVCFICLCYVFSKRVYFSFLSQNWVHGFSASAIANCNTNFTKFCCSYKLRLEDLVSRNVQQTVELKHWKKCVKNTLRSQTGLRLNVMYGEQNFLQSGKSGVLPFHCLHASFASCSSGTVKSCQPKNTGTWSDQLSLFLSPVKITHYFT